MKDNHHSSALVLIGALVISFLLQEGRLSKSPFKLFNNSSDRISGFYNNDQLVNNQNYEKDYDVEIINSASFLNLPK